MTNSLDYDASKYPSFAVTVDLVVFTIENGRLLMAVVERDRPPFQGAWALPGGFVKEHEGLHEAALRELREETGVEGSGFGLAQSGTYGDPDRDPRMRVLSVGYWGLVPGLPSLVAGGDARVADLVEVKLARSGTVRLAFDHASILEDAYREARRAVEESTFAANMCGASFTIKDLRTIYEAVWDTNLDAANFQRRVLEAEGFIEPTGSHRRGGPGRPAELYSPGGASVLSPPFRQPSKRS